jgi:hypothetical protein
MGFLKKGKMMICNMYGVQGWLRSFIFKQEHFILIKNVQELLTRLLTINL